MKPKAIEQLVEDFSDACIQQAKFVSQGNAKKANEQAHKINSLFDQLIETGVKGREELLELIDNSNLVVAKMAAVFSLHYNPYRCLPVLERIAEEPGLLGFGAKQTLRNWKSQKWHIDEDGITAEPYASDTVESSTLSGSTAQAQIKAIDILTEIANGQSPLSRSAREMLSRSQELE